MIYIGIDTGVHTGIAVWDSRKREFIHIGCVAIHEAMNWVRQWLKCAQTDKTGIVVRVEDPRQRTWFGTERMSREEERKRLQGVGSVKRDAGIWDAYLSDLFSKATVSATYEMVAPKRNVTKLTGERFKAITKWQGRTNEHGRDAAMLIFGM